MTRLEEEMRDAYAKCNHGKEHGVRLCVDCAIAAAQGVQNDLLAKYKQRGEELLTTEEQRDKYREMIDKMDVKLRERNEAMNANAARVLELQNKLDAIALAGAAGLTKREHFAGLALQGMLAAGAPTNEDEAAVAHLSFAALAVDFADAMLEALESKKG